MKIGATNPTKAQEAVLTNLDRRTHPKAPRARKLQPLPTKHEAWLAWCNAANDAEETPDRDAFERWWAVSE